MTVTPTTPQTIEGVTVSAPDSGGWCSVRLPNGDMVRRSTFSVRAMGLTVPEPTVPCRIGDQEFTLTREQVEKVAMWTTIINYGAAPIAAAARAHLDADSEAGR